MGIEVIDRALQMWAIWRAPALNKRTDEELLNYALALAQQWGKNWLKPIHERLRIVYPSMSQLKLDHLNSVAQAAMKQGHDLVYSMTKKDGKYISEANWRKSFLAAYPWVDKKNLKHLYGTGKYYAWKDGVG